MVQVDVFWAYSIGAGFAVAASHELIAAPRRRLLEDPRLASTLLYCGLLFAPSGAWLLWGFPDWETMQVASSHAALPPWLVALFAATNIGQGALGYWVARRLIHAGRVYAAYLQAGIGYLAMFFILVHGWDGTGYQRFFSPDRASFATWSEQNLTHHIGQWLGSPVALTLYGMGALLIPAMLALMLSSVQSGHRTVGVCRNPIGLVAAVLIAVLGIALGSAVVASMLVHVAGWWLGIPTAAALIYLVVGRRRNGLAYLLFRYLALPQRASK